MSVEVDDIGSGQVNFIFRNSGPAASSITQIYFDDHYSSVLDSIAAIDNSHPGVHFTTGATPGNLPGGNSVSPAFAASAGLSAGAAVPPPHNGVGPGEWVGIAVNLSTLPNPKSYADVLDGLSSGTFRIGLHVQAFANGQSESFITTPTPVIPAPASVVLTTAGLAVIRLLRNRQVLVI